MMTWRCSTLFCLGIIGWCSVPVLAQKAGADSTGRVTPVPDLVVSSEAVCAPTSGRIVLNSRQVVLEDAGSLADLGGLLPSTRVAVNSRGEATLMIRGAPERHVQTFLDGIPLNLPWDERVDLGSIPLTGEFRLEGRRGLASLLEGPGALAGSVRILAAAPQPGSTSHTSAFLGEHGLTMLNSSVGRTAAAWRLQGGMSWRNRDAWPLPNDGPERFNSDLDQYSFLARASRPVGSSGRFNLLATGWHEKKGVPPELHLGDDARFWRYPERERVLTGASLQLPLGSDGSWDLSAMTALDYFEQKIDPRGPSGWNTPLESGQKYEHDIDRTAHTMLGMTHWLADNLRLTIQGNTRYTHHRERLTVGGDQQAFSQWLTAMVLESEWQPASGWTLRGGVGWDHAATPQTGDKPARSGDDAEALNLRLHRDLNPDTQFYLSASRRSRFPSLREMFSGALGKFVPNPQLKPERQDLIETGLTVRGPRWNLASSIFLQDLHGGIEKEKLPDGSGQFMRVNRTRIRVPGWEIIGSFHPAKNVTLTTGHTVLSARIENGGKFSDPAEDRPDYLSRVSLSWQTLSGLNAMLKTQVIGPRWSADATGTSEATKGLKHLPAGVTWNLRVGYRWVQDGRKVEFHLRVDNLFDQAVSYQVGLPEPGRVVGCGLSLDI